MKVLVIEDNPRLAERIKNHLHKLYLVETAHTGDEAIAIAITHTVDIILLDLGLPDMKGLEVCQKIRELGVVAPILVLTGVDDTIQKVELLDAGADDYMTKPFDADELKARINALERRRHRLPPDNKLEAIDLIMNPAQRTVSRSGQEIQLRRKEFDILEYLLKNKGRVLSRQMIINHAWTSSSATWTGSVDVHIKQLRDKVDRPFSTPIIKTTYGVGYSVETTENSAR
ncbi:MAG: DNA-binding response regulator [Candidatus Saccharibacteria bacterium]|nr:DNA-binding response regulator [Candidatus Saccharibacteria bacterium]